MRKEIRERWEHRREMDASQELTDNTTSKYRKDGAYNFKRKPKKKFSLLLFSPFILFQDLANPGQWRTPLDRYDVDICEGSGGQKMKVITFTYSLTSLPPFTQSKQAFFSCVWRWVHRIILRESIKVSFLPTRKLDLG